MKKCTKYLSIAVVLLVIIFNTPLAGQSLWIKHNHKPTVSLEIYKIKYKSILGYDYYYNTKILNMNAYLSAYIPVSPDLGLLFEIPFTNFSMEEPAGAGAELSTNSQSSIGNPFIGIEYENPEQNFIGTFGVRIPLTSDDKYYTLLQGMRTDPDRAEAFATKSVHFYASAAYNYISDDGINIRAGLGPLLSIPTSTREYDFDQEVELYLRYYSQLWMEADKLSMAAGITGLMWISGDNLSLSERTLHQMNLAGFYQIGIFRPGLFIMTPLNSDLTYYKAYTYGFSLTLEFENSFR